VATACFALGQNQICHLAHLKSAGKSLTFNYDATANPMQSTKPHGMPGANAGPMLCSQSSKPRRTGTLAFQAVFLVIVLLLMGQISIAQVFQGKVDGYEVSVSWLLFAPSGNVQTNSNGVQFGSDLGIQGTQSQVGLWFLIQPWHRSGLFGEFIPYRFDGEQTTTRSFRFGGVTYPPNQSVTSKAKLNYVSAGYMHDIVNRAHIHGRLLAGVAYFGLRSSATSPSVGSAEVNRDIPFPLVGFLARYTHAENSQWSIHGGIRGMTFGSDGSYIDASGALAFNLSQHISVEAGYRTVDGAGHHETRGADLNFHGPTITLRMHD
jgi:hypothetical protein